MKMSALEFFQHKLEHEIDAWDLKEAMEEGINMVVIDARSAQAYEQEHIPFAVNFPHRTMNDETLVRLDREKIYVSYCDGIGCNASTKGAAKLAAHGLKVRELLGGLDWWKRDGYATAGSAATPGMKVNCGC